MEKLLIVEDEKMIRQGIKAIAMRSGVEINEIIECKNGEEAFEIVKNQDIDIMITDIRMPKKDGITLVKEIQESPEIHKKPKIIVISGYDDFSYAVELLRYGAREYILKPIEREQLKKILHKLDKELQSEHHTLDESVQIREQQLKYLLLKQNLPKAEMDTIKRLFENYLESDGYIVFCTNFSGNELLNMGDAVYLKDINNQSVFFIKMKDKKKFITENLKDYYIGVSKIHRQIDEFSTAYQEALEARQIAFFTKKQYLEYTCNSKIYYEEIGQEDIQRIVQLIGTSKIDEVTHLMEELIYRTRKDRITPAQFNLVIEKIIAESRRVYQNIIDMDKDEVDHFKSIYHYNIAEEFFKEFMMWINKLNKTIMTEFDDYKNKQKVQEAILFIQANYNNTINMAVVSNHISMNYSLFSFVFKQYTGNNFTNYLKDIRMKEAKKLLESTDKKIAEISISVGYDNDKHFMKTFKTICGVSPTEYRKNLQIGKSL